jgi:hypothetical protein
MMFGFDDSEFKKATAVILAGLLFAGFMPIIGDLIRLVPMFKEFLLGAAVVTVFTSIDGTRRAIKFALLTGMIAAVAFNIVYIPTQIFLGGLIGASSSGGGSEAASMAVLSGIGALSNLFGLVLFSPFGYAFGGVLGSVLNR